MKAIVVEKPEKLEMVYVNKPVIQDENQVLVKIKAVGICGSDLHILHGSNPYVKYPRILGHEAAGEVEAVGSAVADLKPGDGVIFEPITYCGTCYACRHGHHNVCKNLNVLGCTVDGVFQEYRVVERGQIYPFDTKKLTYIQAALCEPYTIGAQANWRGNVQKEDVVLVHGAGPIGLIVADIAKSKGAVVIVSEPDDHRLEMAQQFGVDYTLNPRKTDLKQVIEQVTAGEGVNVVIDAAGAEGLLENALEILSPAGRLVAMTYGKEFVPIDFKTINAKELTILGTRHQYQKFAETIEILPERVDRINRLITHVFSIDDYKNAFATMQDKKKKPGKIVLTFD